ncbi:hypothetical protein ABW19_dt0208027 [Dactylella cylindrospora]|nr:hypothetical protein ABW19_dt0208027 [Dactylella cylindrospora]
MERWSTVMEPGNTPPVDIYPIFKYMPEKLFGNWITRASNVGRDMEKLYANMLSEYHRKKKNEANRHETFFDILLGEQEKTQEFTAHELAFIGGVQLEGGSDTSASILTAFVQAMVQWPDVQRLAQEEIDQAVGEERSPVWDDFLRLPYVNAIMKETHRWRPVTPLGFPHCLKEDYAASSNWKSRDHYGFGVGRRICPGIHIGERNVFIGIAKLLWAFNFEEAIGGNGQKIKMDIDPRTGYTEGFLHCAHPFKCKISVRNEARMQVIVKEFEAAKAVFTEYTN